MLMTANSFIMAAAGTPFYQDTRFFILVSLILFFALLIWKGVQKSIVAGLDARAQTISDELDEARRLREEAQALLASYHRKQAEAEKLAEDIVSQARRDAEDPSGGRKNRKCRSHRSSGCSGESRGRRRRSGEITFDEPDEIS